MTTASGSSRPVPRGGHPHPGGTANVLFHGGQVKQIKVFWPVDGKNFTPPSHDPKSTQLDYWMILAPGNMQTTATYYGTTGGSPDKVWQRARPLPF